MNTGSYIGTNDLEETVFNTNQEAAAEIARQLRLRNLGGIVVIDFIDMLVIEHREKVYATLKDSCHGDKTKYNIRPISELGILELTRQRIGKTLASQLLEKCPYCKGRGRIHSRDYMCNKIFRGEKFCESRHHADLVHATCHPEVAAILLEHDEYNFKQQKKKLTPEYLSEGLLAFILKIFVSHEKIKLTGFRLPDILSHLDFAR